VSKQDDQNLNTLKDRYRGTLLGLAVGDALGAPLEFLDRNEIATRYGAVRDMIGGGWLNTQPGEFTDDTQMALAIARSIVRQRGVDPADIANLFLSWFDSHPKDIGNTTKRSLLHLAAGVPWSEAGKRTLVELGGSAPSNGSLMRSAPIALACRRNEDALIRHSIDVSSITHADPLACWSCVALNRAIASLLNETEDAIQSASEVPQAKVVRAVIQSSLERDEIRSGGYVLETLQSAFWAFRHHDGFEEVVVAAVNLGGDSDTVGAVAGAIAGARYGAESIPSRWLDVLQSRDELVELADRLLDLS
jgi:ADP-ribosyl-[dinitrogen reductase] hydrolase